MHARIDDEGLRAIIQFRALQLWGSNYFEMSENGCCDDW